MVGCGIRFSDKENSSKEFEIFSLCGISLRNNKICLCDDCSYNLKQPNHNQKKPGSNIMSGELGNDTKNVSISDNRRGSLDSVKEDKPSVGACNHGSGKQ